MAAARTNRAFSEEVPRLIQERGMSLRALAEAANVTGAHLSRVVRGADYKSASGDLAGRVAEALGLPCDYFAEYRLAFIIEELKADARLRDETYDRLKRRR